MVMIVGNFVTSILKFHYEKLNEKKRMFNERSNL